MQPLPEPDEDEEGENDDDDDPRQRATETVQTGRDALTFINPSGEPILSPPEKAAKK